MILKEQIAQYLKESIAEALSTILSLMPKVIDRADVDISKNGNMVVSLSFAGKLEGTIFIILSEDSAQKMVAKMLGCAPEDVSADCLDGIGEVVNIIAGGLKIKLEPMGYDYAISIPSLVRGKCNLSIASLEKAEKIGLFVSCPEISFELVMFYLVNSGGSRPDYKKIRDDKAREAEDELKRFFDKK